MPEPLTCDWHLHSNNSCDSAALPISLLVQQAQEKGIVDYGVTDHIHTEFNLPDLVASRRDWLACDPPPGFHFGVEVSCVSCWELRELARGGHENPVYGLRSGGPEWAEPAIAITEEHIRELGIEYVVAGTHWPLYVPVSRENVIADYHRQNMFLATHPLVDIVAHPWWWMGHWRDEGGGYSTDPWLDDFGKIPASMHEEFAAASVEHGTAVEINISAMLLNPEYPDGFAPQYLEYLGELKRLGVTFSLASDCHSPTYDTDFETPAEMLASVGITDADLWRMPRRSPEHAADGRPR